MSNLPREVTENITRLVDELEHVEKYGNVLRDIKGCVRIVNFNVLWCDGKGKRHKAMFVTYQYPFYRRYTTKRKSYCKGWCAENYCRCLLRTEWCEKCGTPVKLIHTTC